MSNVVDDESLLPWPAAWTNRRPRTWQVMLSGILGLPALVITGLGTWLAFEEGGLMVLLGLGVVCLVMYTCLDLWIQRRRIRASRKPPLLRVSGDALGGITIFYTSRLYHLFRRLLAVTVVVIAGPMWGGILGKVMPSAPHRLDAGDHAETFVGSIGLMVLFWWAAWLLWVVLEIARRRVVRGRLVLTPEGIHHRYLQVEHIVPWRSVLDVAPKDSYLDAPAKELYEGPLVVVRTHPAEAIEVRRTFWGRRRAAERLYSFAVFGPMLAVDPVAAYHALRRYHAHTETRDELVAEGHEPSPDVGYLTEDRPTLDDQVRPS